MLFSAPMVRALRENRKTVTRRTRGLNKINEAPDAWKYVSAFDGEPAESVKPEWHRFQNRGTEEVVNIRSPYGVPGDRLWVREAWSDASGTGGDQLALYRATYKGHSGIAWKPSIHMPRWASRDTLEVVSVRPERLQAITEADAIAEGVQMVGPADLTDRGSFAKLWDSINGPGSWERNDWVWRIEFRRFPVNRGASAG
jgi:hypothetical protein